MIYRDVTFSETQSVSEERIDSTPSRIKEKLCFTKVRKYLHVYMLHYLQDIMDQEPIKVEVIPGLPVVEVSLQELAVAPDLMSENLDPGEGGGCDHVMNSTSEQQHQNVDSQIEASKGNRNSAVLMNFDRILHLNFYVL